MPIVIRAPGLRWRERGTLRVAYWICSQRLIKQGYPVKSSRLWTGAAGTEPSSDEMAIISRECFRLRSEAQDWAKNPNLKKSKKYRQPGFIYFWRVGHRVKIGFTTKLNQRLKGLKTGSNQIGELLGTLPGSREIEGFLHWQFRHYREHGEWFLLEGALLAFISANLKPERPTNVSANGFGT